MCSPAESSSGRLPTPLYSYEPVGGAYQMQRRFSRADVERDFASTEIALSDTTAPADDYGPAPYDVTQVRKVSRQPMKIAKAETFILEPHVFASDACTIDELKQSNGVLEVDGQSYTYTWPDALLHGDTRKKFNVRWPLPLHVNSGSVHYIDLLFQTEHESMRTNEFLQVYPNGVMHLSFTAAQLQAIMGKDVPGIGKHQYNIIPLKIEIRKEYSNLPITYHARLTSAKPFDKSSHVLWSTPSGGHTAGPHECGTGLFHHVIFPGQTIQSANEREPLFVADSYYNSPEFSRWINVDENELRQDLDKSRSLDDARFVDVRCPSRTSVEPQTILEFVIIDEWTRLERISLKLNMPAPQVVEVKGDEVFRVAEAALSYVINDHLKRINRVRMVMRLEALTLRLHPLKERKALHFKKGGKDDTMQEIGLRDLRELAIPIDKGNRPGDLNARANYPSYSAVIRITYETYNGNRRSNTTTGSSDSGLASHVAQPAHIEPTSAASVVYPTFVDSRGAGGGSDLFK